MLIDVRPSSRRSSGVRSLNPPSSPSTDAHNIGNFPKGQLLPKGYVQKLTTRLADSSTEELIAEVKAEKQIIDDVRLSR